MTSMTKKILSLPALRQSAVCMLDVSRFCLGLLVKDASFRMSARLFLGLMNCDEETASTSIRISAHSKTRLP